MHNLSYIKFEPEDFEIYIKIVSSENVMQYILGRKPTKKDNEEKFLKIISCNETHKLGGFFKVFDKKQLIGMCKLEKYSKEENTYEIGYILREDFWGLGYGSKICNDLVNFAKQNQLSDYIIGLIDPKNIGSKKILEKNGFESYFLGIEDGKSIEKLRKKL